MNVFDRTHIDNRMVPVSQLVSLLLWIEFASHRRRFRISVFVIVDRWAKFMDCSLEFLLARWLMIPQIFHTRRYLGCVVCHGEVVDVVAKRVRCCWLLAKGGDSRRECEMRKSLEIKLYAW